MGVSDILILVCESDLAYGGGLGKPKTVGRSEMTYGGENVQYTEWVDLRKMV